MWEFNMNIENIAVGHSPDQRVLNPTGIPKCITSLTNTKQRQNEIFPDIGLILDIRYKKDRSLTSPMRH